MFGPADDFRRLRLRDDPPAPPAPGRSASGGFVGRVVSTSNGVTAGNFVKLNPVLVTGAESEGGAATETADTGTGILALFLGSGTVATGDDLVTRWVPHRWVCSKPAATTTSTAGVTDACTGLAVAGATVTLSGTDSFGDPATYSQTTDASGIATFANPPYDLAPGPVSWTVVKAGCAGNSGTVTATGAPITITTTVNCTSIRFQVLDSCTGAAIAGVAATLARGGTTLGPFNTDGSGFVSFRPTAAGTWTFTGTKSLYVTYTGTATVACGTNADVTYRMALATAHTTTVHVADCAGVVLSGATVTVTISGQAWTGTTNGSGDVVFTGLPATSTGGIAVSMSRYTGYSATDLAASCTANTTYAATLNGGSGFVATSGCPGVPVPQALTLTDPYGTVTINNAGNCPNTIWIGCARRSGTVTARNNCLSPGTGQDFPIQYQFGDDGAGGYSLLAQAPTCTLTGEPDGSQSCTTDPNVPPVPWSGHANIGSTNGSGNAAAASCPSFTWTGTITSLAIYGTSSPVTVTISG